MIIIFQQLKKNLLVYIIANLYNLKGSNNKRFCIYKHNNNNLSTN